MTNGNLILTIVTVFYIALLLKPIIYKMQSGGYSAASLIKDNLVFIRQYRGYFLAGLIFSLAFPVGFIFDFDRAFLSVYSVLYFTVLTCVLYKNSQKTLKVPFVFTARAARLYVLEEFLLSIMLIYSVAALCRVNAYIGALPAFLMPVLLPFFAEAVLLIIIPFEKLNNKRYINRAAKIIASKPYLIKIGITGSFGKTSVKNILKAMLETKYTVVATEGNYNTPLGIAKTSVNIDGYTDVFIAEMGARHVGDIKELVNIVKPSYGIVTGVTGQHLETFKSLENIYNEKLSLIYSLPPDGYGVVNRAGFSEEIKLPPCAEYAGTEGSICYVKDAILTRDGASFTLWLDKKAYSAETKLLGRHNLCNIVSASAMAYKLKISPEKIIWTIKNLPQTPHRLQLLKNGGITVIDDTYNANPAGVGEALNVLGQFEGRKIVITPGMVELGEREAEENGLFGESLADVADIVILIGVTRARQISAGLAKKGYPQTKILNFKTLAEAERCFPQIFKAGDVVLFINDLPDCYAE